MSTVGRKINVLFVFEVIICSCSPQTTCKVVCIFTCSVYHSYTTPEIHKEFLCNAKRVVACSTIPDCRANGSNTCVAMVIFIAQ